MGRFASTVEFYARYREPYSPKFFKKVAGELAFRGDESLLDVGCGPGLLAIGFAPYVGGCTGLDPEDGMIAAAKARAAEAGVALSLIQGRIEEFSRTGTYDVITIGRALHWMQHSDALRVLERILAPDSGRILICRASSRETPENNWLRPYRQLCRAWASGLGEKHSRMDVRKWFAASGLRALGETVVTEWGEVTIPQLIGRALSKSRTSPEILAGAQARFESEIAAVLEPFVRNGVLVDQIAARASVFGRPAGS